MNKDATGVMATGQPGRHWRVPRAGYPGPVTVRCDSSDRMRFIRYSFGPFLHGVETGHSESFGPGCQPGTFLWGQLMPSSSPAAV